jgi:nucleotide-binding universal stress UspA family protein
MSPPIPPPTPGPGRSSRRRSTRGAQGSGWSAPKLIGVAVDGHPSGRDAVVLASLLATATSGELMLIAVHEEPLVPVALPGEMSWSAIEQQARAMLAETRDSLAPDARIMVHADTLVWRGLRQVVRHEHRDLLVVGSAEKVNAGRVRLGRSAGELLGHLECPLAIAPSGFRQRAKRTLDRVGVGFNGTPESQAALDLAASIAAAAAAPLEVRGAIDDGVAGGLSAERTVLEEDGLTERQLIETFERNRAATSRTSVPTNVEVQVGMPTDVLSELCDEVDLLVLGSERSAPLGRVQLGRTGRAMLGLATCPVLVVPRPAAPRSAGGA